MGKKVKVSKAMLVFSILFFYYYQEHKAMRLTVSPAFAPSAGMSFAVIKIDLFLNLGPDVPDVFDRTEPVRTFEVSGDRIELVRTFDTEDRRELVRPLSNWEYDL